MSNAGPLAIAAGVGALVPLSTTLLTPPAAARLRAASSGRARAPRGVQVSRRLCPKNQCA